MNNSLKRITSIAIKDRSKNIGPSGETRLVTIKGDPTATFTLTATTVSGCSVLEEEIENFQLPSSGEYKFNIKLNLFKSPYFSSIGNLASSYLFLLISINPESIPRA